jgi:WD40 repeat protein
MTGTEMRKLQGHTESVTSVAFTSDGTAIASGSWDQTVRLWNVTTGTEMRKLRGHMNTVTSVAFASDGKIVASGSSDQTVRLWNITTGTEMRKLQGHTNWVTSVAFSPDEKTIASASWDQTVRLWNVTTGTEMRKLQGHTSFVTTVAFSPDGKVLASSSYDGSIRFWTADGTPLLVLRAVSDHDASYAFTPGPAPYIELLGPEAELAAQYPLCRIGPLAFPFDLCRERFEVHGLFAKALAARAIASKITPFPQAQTEGTRRPTQREVACS